MKNHIAILRGTALLCLIVFFVASSLSAGNWNRTWMDEVVSDDATVNAEILLLKDGRFSLTEDFSVQHLQIPLSFKDEDDQHLRKLPKLAVGEESGFRTFLVYSTTKYEGTMYATISTLVCVPKHTLTPVVWEPKWFTDRTPTGIGEVEEDPRYHLHNLMVTNELGETVRLLPKHKNSTNDDKPWEDYTLWLYKDYTKAYPLKQLETVFTSPQAGPAFKVTSLLKEIRNSDYVYPCTIVPQSISIEVSDDMDATVYFEDTAAAEASNGASYEYEIEQLLYGMYWQKSAEGSIRGKQGSKDQVLLIKNSISQDKKYRIVLRSKWSGYSSEFELNSVSQGFASIAGTVTGREDDEKPHNFDDIIFQGQ